MRKFLIFSKDVQRDSFIWNMLGSMLMAFQSVIFLMVLTRTVGLIEAGIFTIAYANANLFLTIGKYGMRYFHVSDVKREFSFADYQMSRWITTAAMMITAVVYVAYTAWNQNYSPDKALVIIWMCIFKIPDVIEDVYYGEYQREGRLDIASKVMTVRVFTTMIVYLAVLILCKNQLAALIVSTIYTFVVMAILLKETVGLFAICRLSKSANVKLLLKQCFPLFAGSFLAFYIGNAPKYAIDALLTDELQACYGFIAMPVFVIGLLNGFIFNPMLYRITCVWEERRLGEFTRQILLQIFYIVLITGICMIAAYLIGIPVLSFLYHTDLTPYKKELLILLLGGGFLGASGLLNAAITIMRKQKALLWGYLAVAVVALFLSKVSVKMWGMLGASMLYMILMLGLCMCFAVILIKGMLDAKKRKSNE